MNPGFAGNHAPYDAELARRSGVHPVMVHEVETGKKRGSADTLKRLAEALGVTVDDVV